MKSVLKLYLPILIKLQKYRVTVLQLKLKVFCLKQINLIWLNWKKKVKKKDDQMTMYTEPCISRHTYTQTCLMMVVATVLKIYDKNTSICEFLSCKYFLYINLHYFSKTGTLQWVEFHQLYSFYENILQPQVSLQPLRNQRRSPSTQPTKTLA